MKKIAISALMGVIALAAVHFTGFLTTVVLPINLLSLSVSSALGIPGVISMLVIDCIIK